MTRNNHYVPQMYLKHFASERGITQRYRVLVSRASIPPWKPVNVAGVGYQTHLYTRIASGVESDEVELWLNEEFESPAESAIAKAVADLPLAKEDYRILVRFVASQIVRTPAFLMRSMPKWLPLAEHLLQELMDGVPDALRRLKLEGSRPQSVVQPLNDYLPLKVTQERAPDGKSVMVKAETVVGRGYWLFVMRHALTETLNILFQHKWTVLRMPTGSSLFTSDDPVVCLNFQSIEHFDFGGGWAQPGAEILLPLSPTRLLYTQIARKVPMRGTVLSREHVMIVRRILARHAFRYIFSEHQDEGISFLRPRVVDHEACLRDSAEWRKWHDEQTKAELEMQSFEPTPHVG